MGKNRKKYIYFAVAILIFLAKFIGNTIFLYLAKFDSPEANLWKIITSLSLVASIGIFIFYDIKKQILDITNLFDRYQSELFRLIMYVIFLMIGSIFISISVNLPPFPENVFQIFFGEILAVIGFIFIILTAKFLYLWFSLRKFKNTKLFIVLIAASIGIIVLTEIIAKLGAIDSLGIMKAIGNVMVFGTIIFSIILSKRTSWVSSINRKDKYKLFWTSFLGSIFLIIFTISTFDGKIAVIELVNNITAIELGFLIPISIALTAHTARIAGSALLSLPNASIVDRRSSELSSLTYLNRFIAESLNEQSSFLLDTVNKLAFEAVESSITWIETYDDNLNVSIAAAINIDPNLIRKTHDNFNLKYFFLNTHHEVLVESLLEHDYLYQIKKTINRANSLILVPLNSGTDRIGSLVLIHVDEYGFETEDLKVLSAFSDNVRIALENSRLVNDSIEKEKYKNELMIAHNIQNKLLPQELPDIPNFGISAFTIPAAEVGGDYYDIVKLKNGRFCLLIGDVSGKGMSAAFYMAQLKGIVLSLAAESETPAGLLKRINQVLFGNMERQMYITMGAISIDDEQGNLTLARAGHMPFIIMKKGDSQLITPNGLGVGLTSGKMFDKLIENKPVTLSPGESLLAFTDGINELRDIKGREFGIDTISMKLLNGTVKESEEIADYLRDDLMKYCEGTAQADDMTLLALTYYGK